MSVDERTAIAPLADAEVRGHLQAFADVGFWERDLRTGALYLSTQVFEMLGIEEPTLEAYLSIVHPDDVPLLCEVDARARAQPGPYRLRHRTADGERVLQVRVQSVAGASGEPERFLGMISDVTAEWQLEQALELSTSARLTGLMASGAIHDLKNIFAVISGHTHLVNLAAECGERPGGESLAALATAAQRGLELTSQLLQVGRSGPVTARRISIEDVFRRLEVTAATVLGRHRRLIVDPGPGDVDLVGDESRLERVLVDLVLNARDALPTSDGSVRISFRALTDSEAAALQETHQAPSDAYGVIEVCDDGTGIAPDVLVKVTEPFFTTKAAVGGSGVGLHTVARFAESAGGVLEIDSELGVGTSVRLVLPTRQRASRVRPRPRSARVVVHGDDDERLVVVADALSASGMQVVPSVTDTSTIRLLRTEPIDVLVLDGATPARDHRLLRTAGGTSTAVLGVSEVTVGAATGQLSEDDVAAVVDAVHGLLGAS